MRCLTFFLLVSAVALSVGCRTMDAERKQAVAKGLKIHFALFAEQVVSPRESDCPRRPLGPAFDYTGDFEAKLKYLDKAGVGTYWLYGFRGGEGTVRDIGLLKAAKAKLERYGKKAYIICEPLGHPCDEPPAGAPERAGPPGKGWRYRINADGRTDWGTACLDDVVLRDLVAATKAFRDAGFRKVFFDDDLRMGVGHGRVRWGDTSGGCFCDQCVAGFNRKHGTNYTRADLREIVMNPDKNPEALERWIAYNCDKITGFMKAVNLPGIQVGIMVMFGGNMNQGVDLAAIQKAVPDCMVRVGESHFNNGIFDHPNAESAVGEGIDSHKAQVGDVSRLYSENTVCPWPEMRPDNMARKMLLEVRHGLRNIMLMPPQLLDSPAHWEAIAGALPKALAIAAGEEL
ncbi:MAG: hypothetical protein WCL44_14925 [bacterium]